MDYGYNIAHLYLSVEPRPKPYDPTQQDARSKVLEKDESKITNFWKKIVGSGSNMAVNVSKLV